MGGSRWEHFSLNLFHTHTVLCCLLFFTSPAVRLQDVQHIGAEHDVLTSMIRLPWNLVLIFMLPLRMIPFNSGHTPELLSTSTVRSNFTHDQHFGAKDDTWNRENKWSYFYEISCGYSWSPEDKS